MGLLVATRHLRSTKQNSHDDNAQTLETAQPSTSDRFGRAVSALAHYQPHKLSEIREVSGSSDITLPQRYSLDRVNSVDGVFESQDHSATDNSTDANEATTKQENVNIVHVHHTRPPSAWSDIGSQAPSALSLPFHEIPRRKSSMSALSQSFPGSHNASLRDIRTRGLEPRRTISTNKLSNSPVKHALEHGAQSSDILRPSPSRTFVRTTTPFYLLDNADHRNSRLEMAAKLPSPLFVGGGTVEGQIELKLDMSSNKKLKSKPLFIARLSIDIIGVEEVEDGKRRIFLSLATELFDSQHPPPSTLVVSQTPEKGSELYWRTQPATATIPFCVNLPLKLGPPPYTSRQASIRYLFCPSVVIKVGEKRSAVRQAWTIQMLTVHDPERALASLPSPLLATETLTLSHTPVVQSVKLTAGLHRQTWVSGGVVFTDIHVVNGTDRAIKRIELELQKSTLWFSHSVAGTAEKRANNLRLPNKIDTETVHRSAIRKGKDWDGIEPQASEIRTCKLDIPKGHVTIGGVRYFEVRYYIKITIVLTRNKKISVQLPVTIIHINSLDIMPNSLAQVAASIEAKRSMHTPRIGSGVSHPPHSQGQAFVAGQQQSANRSKRPADSMASEDVKSLMRAIDDSPRHTSNQHTGGIKNESATKVKTGNENVPLEPAPCHRHPSLRSTCYHCHLLDTEYASKVAAQSGPKLPRLQVSTSGLGFSESEFEIPPDSPPRKVMLSEKEREMINQQRELRVQRQWSLQKPKGSASGQSGWKNVAVPPDIKIEPLYRPRNQSSYPIRHLSQLVNAVSRAQRSSLPPMSGTDRHKGRPERTRASFSDVVSTRRPDRASRGVRAMEEGDRYPWSGYSLVDNDVFGPNSKSDELTDTADEQNLTQPQKG